MVITVCDTRWRLRLLNTCKVRSTSANNSSWRSLDSLSSWDTCQNSTQLYNYYLYLCLVLPPTTYHILRDVGNFHLALNFYCCHIKYSNTSLNEYSNDSPNRSGIYRGFFVPRFVIIFAIDHYVTNTVTLASTQTKTENLRTWLRPRSTISMTMMFISHLRPVTVE